MVQTRSRRDYLMSETPGTQNQSTSSTTAGSDRRSGGAGRRDTSNNRQTATGTLDQTGEIAYTEQNSQNTTSRAVTVRNVSQRDNHRSSQSSETTLAGRPRLRMKWNQEMNIFVMRSYYQITRLETEMTDLGRKLHESFTVQFPNITANAQRVADQRRTIVRNKLLSEEIIEQIKREVQEELNQGRNITPETQAHDAEHNEVTSIPTVPENRPPLTAQGNRPPLTAQENRPSEGERPENNMTTIEEQHIKDLKDRLHTTCQKYSGMDPTKRPRIPKQKTSVKFAKIVDTLNTYILPEFPPTNSFSELHDLVYCTAVTAAEANGARIIEAYQENSTQRPNRLPPWQRRLMNKIETKRAEIGRLQQYRRGNPSRKLRERTRKIFDKYKVHTPRDIPNNTVLDFIDTLKQKLNVFSTRLRRYSECTKRKKQNTEFQNNEKRFYSSIKSEQEATSSEEIEAIPNKEQITNYWSSIWNNNTQSNTNTNWIRKEQQENENLTPMDEPVITLTILREVIKSTHNWKGPGSDNIHNYWYKKLTCLHSQLVEYLNTFIKHPELTPPFITQGKTYLIPKGNISSDPSKYRPITCLQTVYKILTSCITQIMNAHIDNNQIMCEEQKGCKKGAKGCKEQLIIDEVILKQVRKRNKKLACCYIDYQKAYDSVPHSWLIQVLEIYKIHPVLVDFLRQVMKSWKTVVQLNNKEKLVTTSEIKINRGIYQGDSLSPLWFCLALNPLSKQLNRTKIGYTLNNDQKISHQLYMDDLKLYAPSQDRLKELIMIVERFSKDICMKFGLDKCKIINIDKGKCMVGDVQTSDGGVIESMAEGDVYKYLGYQQARAIEQTSTKKALTKEYVTRVTKLCRTELNSKHLFKAINTFAIPVLTYSFGIIGWSDTDLQSLMRKTRTELTKHRKLHPKSSTLRTTLPRKEGGRGLIDIQNLHNSQINQLRTYFHRKKSTSGLHESICLADLDYTPLNLANEEMIKSIQGNDQKHQEWRSKVLHGRHPHELDQNNVDIDASNAWLSSGELFPETEGFMIAIQDQVISTKNYLKHIIKDPNTQDDRCRMCGKRPETIQHLTSACEKLAQTEYLQRHNRVAAIVHQQISQNLNLITHSNPCPYYKYEPAPVLESARFTLYYDRSILTDRAIPNNRPDIILRDKQLKKVYLVDIAVPNSHNIEDKLREKVQKYRDLGDEVKRMWDVDFVKIIPLVLSATGIIPRCLKENLEILGIKKNTAQVMQKSVILNTTRIIRKVLGQ